MKKAIKAAFPHTIPIMASFILVGMAYGIFAHTKGLSFLYPMIMSIVVFSGSMEFVAVSLLALPFDPLYAFLLALIVSARYFFYGISQLSRFRGLGKKKYYMIYATCDETFSLNCTTQPPPDVDKGKFMCAITILDQIYWVTGATIGGLLGAVLSFDTRGIDFILTALYVVLFIDQWKSTKEHTPALTGLLSSVACLAVFGASNFVLPALLLVLTILLLLKNRLHNAGDAA